MGDSHGRKTVFSIVKITTSNFIKLFSGVLVAFLIPKIMGIDDYGIYKTFTLYATYVGIFQVGFTDGIYLKYGDKDYCDINENRFSFYSLLFISLQAVFALLFALFGLFAFGGDYVFLISMLGIFLFSTNVIAYYQMISQITLRFNELSIRNIVQSLLNVVSIVGLFVYYRKFDREIPFRWYVIVVNAIGMLLAVWYVFTYRRITFSRPDPKGAKADIGYCVKIGFPLMIANLCSTFILVIDRQFVNVLFENTVYAVYAFAYNLLGLITTVTSAISIVLYPTMKREDHDSLVVKYPSLCSIIFILLFLCCLVYFPMTAFIPWFLPAYVGSLPIFRIVLPGLAVQSVVTIVMHNYYKNDLREMEFFIKSVVILALSAAANVLAYVMFHTTFAISVASIVVMVVWYFVIEEYMVRKYRAPWKKNALYMATMFLGFYLISLWDLWWAALAVYAVFYAAVTFLLYRKDMLPLIRMFLKRGDPANSQPPQN